MGIAGPVVFCMVNDSSSSSLALCCEVVIGVVVVVVATLLLSSPSNPSSDSRCTFFSVPLSPPLSSAAIGGGRGVAEAEFLGFNLLQTSTRREGVGKPCL